MFYTNDIYRIPFHIPTAHVSFLDTQLCLSDSGCVTESKPLGIVRRRRHISTTASPVDICDCVQFINFYMKRRKKALTDVFASLELRILLPREHLECMRAKIVALCLEEVCGHDLAAVAIEEGESGAEGGCRDTPKNGLGNDTSPARLSLVSS